MLEAIDLVEALGDPGVSLSARRAIPQRWNPMRSLAWAAAIVAVIGLGFAGRIMLNLNSSPLASGPRSSGPHARDEMALRDSGPSASGQASSDMAVNQAQPAPESEPAALATRKPLSSTTGLAIGPGTAGGGSAKTLEESAEPITTASRAQPLRSERTDSAARYMERVPAQSGSRGSGFVAGASAASAQLIDTLKRDQPDVAARRAQTAAPTELRANEVSPAPTPQAPRDAVSVRQRKGKSADPDSGFRTISHEDALKLLAGKLRRIDGLEPIGYKVKENGPGEAPIVRTVYAVAAALQEKAESLTIRLDQQRTGPGDVTSQTQEYSQSESGNPVSGSPTNSLRWIDIDGFSYILLAPLPGDSLLGLKARIK